MISDPEITRRRATLPLLLVIVSLAALALLPIIIQGRIGAIRREISDVADPARTDLTELQLALALELAGTRGFLLTGDRRYAAARDQAHATKSGVYARLLPLARRLGPDASVTALALGEHMRSYDALDDALVEGRLLPSEYVARLDDQQARFRTAVAAAGRLDAVIRRTAAELREDILVTERINVLLTALLVLLALASALLVAQLGRQYRGLVHRLEFRVRQQQALREVARELSASLSVGAAMQTIAEHAVATTPAFGAYVEQTEEPKPGTEVEIVAVAGTGSPPLGTRIPYPGSLSEEIVESREPRILTEVGAIGERLAPYLGEGCVGGSGLVVPLASEETILGALVLLRGPEQPHFTPEEAAHARILGDLASSALRRVMLLEKLTESERAFRALGDSIPQLAWMADPSGSFYWYNQRWYEYSGMPPEQTEGWGWTTALHPDHAASVVERLRHAFATGQPWEDTFPFRSRTGEYRWFLSRALPIRNREGQLIRWVGTNTDVTERVAASAERELLLKHTQAARADAERRQAELERVTESRTRLMRGFSHDVKNPLGAADGHAQLLEDGILGELSEQQRDSVGRIRRAIHTSLHLINDLLELARAEAGQLEIAREPTDVAAIASEVTDDLRAKAEAKGLTLDIHAADDAHTETDPARVRQVLGNLLSNAVKYTREGQVAVTVEPHADGEGPRPGEWIAVRVRDTGPGIPPDKRERIFQEFTRLDPDAEQGAGVGLAISRRISELMGGEITLDSEVGRGSTFTLWIPRVASSA